MDFFTCASCFAQYLNLPDIIGLISTSKDCYNFFTSPQVWLSIYVRNNIPVDPNLDPNPYKQLGVRGIPKELKNKVAGHWKFNSWESNNRLVSIDLSGNKNHVEFRSPSLDYKPDVRNGILIKSGHNFYAETTDKNNLNARKSFSVEVVLKSHLGKFSNYDYGFPVISKHGNATGWELRLSPNSINFVFTVEPYRHHTEVQYRLPDIDSKKWYHIAGTFDGKEAKLYFDGELVNRSSVPKDYTRIADYNINPMAIGISSGFRDRGSFAGKVREARVCYATLTPDQFLRKPVESKEEQQKRKERENEKKKENDKKKEKKEKEKEGKEDAPPRRSLRIRSLRQPPT